MKLDKDLARPGDLTESCSFPFEFLKVVKEYDSYTGRNVRLRLLELSLFLIPEEVHFAHHSRIGNMKICLKNPQILYHIINVLLK